MLRAQPCRHTLLDRRPLRGELLRTEPALPNDCFDRRQKLVGHVRARMRVRIDDDKGAHDRKNASLLTTAPVTVAVLSDFSSSTSVPISCATTCVDCFFSAF